MKTTSSLMIILAMTIGGTHASFAKDTIDIVAFNAENLFDTIDDIDNPRDDAYLPLSVRDRELAA